MLCRSWRSGGLGVGRALMRSGLERTHGSKHGALCYVLLPHILALTYLIPYAYSIQNGERCVLCRSAYSLAVSLFILSLHSLPCFPTRSCFSSGSIPLSIALVLFSCISRHFHPVMLRSLTHRYHHVFLNPPPPLPFTTAANIFFQPLGRPKHLNISLYFSLK
jgi:prepilin signal peptidase PulO-like enzyme (type II secretory pathway)